MTDPTNVPAWLVALRNRRATWGVSTYLAEVGGIECCCTEANEGVDLSYEVPGHLPDIPQVVADAMRVGAITGRPVGVLFIDADGTAQQVEEAMFATADAGVGIACLAPVPQV